MAESPPAAFGGQLDPGLRRDLEDIAQGIPLDEGGGASIPKIFLLAELMLADQVSRIVEIGVYRGRLLLPLARVISALGRGEAVGIDPYSPAAAIQRDVELEGIDLVEWPTTVDWQGLHDGVLTAIDRWGLGEHTRLVRLRSEEAAAEFAGAPIDLLHIDGNHDRRSVEGDLERFLPHVRDGGILVMDDISWPSIQPLYEEMAREHELLFSLTEKKVFLWLAGGGSDFAVLRVRK